MMNQEEFNLHNKNELYQIYVDIFQKLKKKTQLSKNLLFRQVNFCLKKGSQMTIQRNQVKSRTNITPPPIIREVRVRRFEPKEVSTKHKILLLEAVW